MPIGMDELPNAIGVLYTTNVVGNLFGPAIAGALLDSTLPDTSYLPVQIYCGLCTIVGSLFIIWLRVMRSKKWFVRV
jgi:hypothetical protein